MADTATSKRGKITPATWKTKLAPGQSELTIRDIELPGFSVRIRPAGATYYYAGRVGGKRRKVTIGSSLDVTAADARQQALQLRQAMRDGVDPLERVETADDTFEAVAAKYADLWEQGALARQSRIPAPASIKSHHKDMRRALAFFDGVRAAEIDKLAARRFIATLEDETGISPSVRKKAFGAVSRVMDFAVSRGFADENVFRNQPSPAGSTSRERYLTEDEVARLWDATLKVSRNMRQYARILRFCIAQPVRTGIARSLRWQHVDLDAGLLTIPSDMAGNKARSEMILPLTATAIEVLTETDEHTWRDPDALVFIGRNGGMTSMGSTPKTVMDELSGVSSWQVHDLRRTAVTLPADRFAEFDAAAGDLWLAHTPSGVAATYQRARRIKAMRGCADAWDRVLRPLIGREPVDNVVQMPG